MTIDAKSHPFITLVSGLPRSGTSMMMQMLDAGGMPAMTDRQRSADDDNPQGYFELEAVKQTKRDASWVGLSVGKAVKVIYALLYDLPREYCYRVIFLERNISEVLASQAKMLERRGQQGANATPDQLANIFREQLIKAQQWVGSQPNFASLVIEHHHVVSAPEHSVARIDEFLGGGLDQSAMAAAVNAKLYRQRAK